MKQESDPVSHYLNSKLSAETAQALADYKDSSSANSRSLQAAVLQDLNDIVKNKAIYDPE